MESPSLPRTPSPRRRRIPRLRETKTIRHLVENINVAIRPTKRLLAGSPRPHSNVRQRVHALRLVSRQRAIHDEPVDGVLGVGVVVRGIRRRNGRGARAVGVDLVVLAAVWVGAEARGDGVARGPVEREVGPRVVRDAGLLDGVLRQARVCVDADGLALCAVVFLLG